MTRLDLEMQLYHDCYGMAKSYGMNDETAAHEALEQLKFFIEHTTDDMPESFEVAKIVMAEFLEYLKSW